MISKYYFRPRYYVNKKLALDSYKLECEDLGIKEKLEQKPNFVSRKVSNLEELRATDLLLDETIKVVFVAGRKARLNVHAIETK
jgi:hypothetical protein